MDGLGDGTLVCTVSFFSNTGICKKGGMNGMEREGNGLITQHKLKKQLIE